MRFFPALGGIPGPLCTGDDPAPGSEGSGIPMACIAIRAAIASFGLKGMFCGWPGSCIGPPGNECG